MSVLMQQHEGHKAVLARLTRVVTPSPKPKPPRPISPFIREIKRQRMLAWEAMIYLRQNPVPTEWNYMPPVRYDHCDGGPSAYRRTMAGIIAEVAQVRGLSITEIKSSRRATEIVAARHEAMWRCRQETTQSLPAIGRALGGKDHTTVLHGIRAHEKRMRLKTGAKPDA